METNSNQTLVLTPEQEHQNKSTTAMVFGIVGLALIVLPGLNLIGLALSITGLVLAVKNRKAAAALSLTESNSNKAGFVCGLIGTILGAIGTLLILLAVILFIGVINIAVATPDVATAISEALPQIEDALENAVPGALNLLPTLAVLL